MSVYKKRLCAGIFVLTIVLAFIITALLPVNTGKTEGTRISPEMLLPALPETETVENGVVQLDASNASQGYIMAKYDGDNPKVKVSIEKDGNENIYDVTSDRYGEYQAYPLPEGDGEYEVTVYENVSGITYLPAYVKTVEAELEDELLPFLYPSQQVDYDADSYAVIQAAVLAATADNDFDVVEKVYSYLAETIEYDYELAGKLKEENGAYIPDVDEALQEKKGICSDYATVMAAMLRSQGIPTKVIVGRAIRGEEVIDHAWVHVYISDDVITSKDFQMDATLPGWVAIDPTYASTAKFAKGLVSGQTEYIEDYCY